MKVHTTSPQNTKCLFVVLMVRICIHDEAKWGFNWADPLNNLLRIRIKPKN